MFEKRTQSVEGNSFDLLRKNKGHRNRAVVVWARWVAAFGNREGRKDGVKEGLAHGIHSKGDAWNTV